VSKLLTEFFPEVEAGGYTRCDGTIEFYSRIRSLIEPTSVVLDLGAGRGKWVEDLVSYRRQLRQLQGRGGDRL
jgi:hypothetical protein